MIRQAAIVGIFLGFLTACTGLAPQPTATDAFMESAKQTMRVAGEIPTETATFPAGAGQPNLSTITPTSTAIYGQDVAGQGGDRSQNPGACVPDGAPRQVGLVVDVVDSVTLLVEIDGKTQKVGYIGLDQPANRYYRPQAADVNYKLTINQVVMLYRDVSDKDSSGRLMRYVFLSNLQGIFANYELLRQGYAITRPLPPDISCNEIFRQAEDVARLGLNGLWAPTPIPSSTGLRLLPTFTIPPGNTVCDPSYPTVCIPPPPPYFNCGNIIYRHFPVIPPDPHNFDSDGDGIGCEK